MALPPHTLSSGQRNNNFQRYNKTHLKTCFCCHFPRSGRSQTKIKIPGIPRAPCVTFLPAEPGVPQDPILVVIKVDFPVGWEEGVGQFPRGAIEAVVGQGLQAVRVVDGVESCGKSSSFRVIQQDQPAQETPGSLERSLMGSPRHFPASRAT